MSKLYFIQVPTDANDGTWENLTVEGKPWTAHRFETIKNDVAMVRAAGLVTPLRIVESVPVTFKINVVAEYDTTATVTSDNDGEGLLSEDELRALAVEHNYDSHGVCKTCGESKVSDVDDELADTEHPYDQAVADQAVLDGEA